MKLMEEGKKKRKRIKVKREKVTSSGPLKIYPIQEEVFNLPKDDDAEITYNRIKVILK
jgi:hypothetical protein